MSFLRTLLVALVAGGLGAYIWFVEAPKIAEESREDRLLDFEPETVSALRLRYPDGSKIEVRREGGQWNLVEPLDAKADATAVENFLQSVADTKIERRLAEDEAENLASYGLDGDDGKRGSLGLSLEGGIELPRVVVGNTTPVDYQAFVRREDSGDVLVTPLLLHTTIEKKAFDFRDKSLVELDPSSVARLTIERDGTTIDLERKDAEWHLLAPIADRADSEAVESMLSSFSTIDALAFFDGDDASQEKRREYGLESPALRVKADGNGSQVEFSVGNETADPPAGFYFAAGTGGPVAKVADWVPKKFAVAASELRDRRLAPCRPELVLRLDYEVGDERYSVRREGAGKPWIVEPLGAGETVSQRTADNMLVGILASKGDEILADVDGEATLARFGLDDPLARLRISTGDGECAMVAVAARPQTDTENDAGAKALPSANYAVHVEGRSVVLSAGAGVFSRLGARRSAYVEQAKPAPSPDEGAADGETPPPPAGASAPSD